jgi:hypothetical protein
MHRDYMSMVEACRGSSFTQKPLREERTRRDQFEGYQAV